MRNLWSRCLAILIPALGLAVANCQVERLFEAPPAPLSVSPERWADSAAVGSRADRVMQLAIRTGSDASVPWMAWTARGSAWLELSPPSGTTPGVLTVAASPPGLPVASHHDTIVISTAGEVPNQARVPIEFRIVPCSVTPITLDAVIEDSLTRSDCAAPHRSGHLARLYRFTGAAGDSVSIALRSPAFAGFVILDSSSAGGAPALGESDRCAGAPGSACLRYQLLPRGGPFVIEATGADTSATGTFTLRVTRPQLPLLPTGLGQLSGDSVTALPAGGETPDSTVVVEAVLTDPDDFDSLQLEVEAKPVGAPFTGGGSTRSAPVGNGGRGLARVDGLSDGVAYHWRARVLDQTGRASPWVQFGGNPEDAPDFRVSSGRRPAPPTALAQFKIDGTTPITVGGTTNERSVTLSAMVTAGAPDDHVRLEVEVRPVGTPFTQTATAASVLAPSGSTVRATAAGLENNAAYRWQARTVDQSGRPSAWVAFGDNADTDADFQVTLPTTRLVFLQQPTGTAAGSSITPPVQVAAQDAGGQTITGFAGEVVISLGENPGAGTLSGTTRVAASSGVATFSNLSIDQAGRGYTLIATSSGLPSVVSNAFDITEPSTPPPTAVRLAFVEEPTTTEAGQPITPAVRVAAHDANGNTVTGYSGTVTIALGANPAAGRLSGDRTRNAVSGIATFPDLSIDQPGSGYTLTAAASQLAADTSARFDITAPPAPPPPPPPPPGATKLTFVQQPSTTEAGKTITPEVKVAAQDANGNTVTGYTGSVTIALGNNPGGGTLSGRKTVDAVSGVATFGDLSIDKAGDGYTLKATASQLTSATSQAFDITAPPPPPPPPPPTVAQLVFTVQPSNTTVNNVIKPPVEVTALDASGNQVTTFTGTIRIAIGNDASLLGNAQLHGTRSVSAVNGVARFADLRIDQVGAGYTLLASTDGVPSKESRSFNVLVLGLSGEDRP